MNDSLAEAHEDLYSVLNVMLIGDADPILEIWGHTDRSHSFINELAGHSLDCVFSV